MIKTFKVKLLPNNNQNTRMFQYAGCSRFAYNWALGYEKDLYDKNEKFKNDCELRKVFTELKKQDDYKWLNDVSNDVTKQAIKDAYNSYIRFFKGYSKLPKFKSKKHSKNSFYQDTSKIKFTGTHVKIEAISKSRRKNRLKINWIKLAEKNRIPYGENVKYMNPRFTFDGLNWYVSVSVEIEQDTKEKANINDGIGIDLGIKDLAICSDKNTYKNINKSARIRKTEKKKRRLQRSISRKYIKNKKGESYCKTRNIIKGERKLLKINKRLTNIRNDYIHKTTHEIINRKPRFICIEDLNVSGMMKNKHLSKAIQQQKLYEFRRQIEYKSQNNNIKLVIADRFYPSSKRCNCCGSIKKDLKLSDRVYKCECGYINDRDYNASLNLKYYGENSKCDI